MDEVERRAIAAGKQCTYCPRLCRHACPVETASGREALTPKHKMQTALELREDRRVLLPDEIETLWGCSACGACEDACLHGNLVGEALYDARAIAVARGRQPAVLAGVRTAFERHVAADESLDRAAYREVAEHGRLRGAVIALLEDAPEALARPAFLAARRTRPDAKLASMWGASGPAVIRSGRALREAGERAAYERHVARVAQALSDCEEWWVLELSSLEDFERAASTLAHPPRVRSLVEVIAAAGLGPSRRFRSLALHASCATRGRPRVEEAISVLAHRLSDDVRTPGAEALFSGCCGGRGAIAAVFPSVAAEMAAGRTAELKELRAELTVTFSTPCHTAMPGAIHGVPFFAPTDW